jgi:hypothetical protein
MLDSRMCYLSNADLDAALRLRLRAWQRPGKQDDMAVDLTIDDLSSAHTLAMGSFRVRSPSL